VSVDVVWLDAQPLRVGQRYAFRRGPKSAIATVASIEHQRDVNGGQSFATEQLALNAIGRVELVLDQALPIAGFAEDPALGAFILVDRATHATAGAGTIIQAVEQGAARAYWQPFSVDASQRAAAKQQTARCLWLTGLSGAGKSTLADAVERRLAAEGRHTMLLDGDNLRTGLSRDLGFSAEDRSEHVRRVGEVAKLMVDAGLVVIVSAISPFRVDRNAVRARFGDGQFVEVFVDASPETCAARDPKGLYAKARSGGLANPIGIGSDYERPEAPEVHVVTDETEVEALVEQVLRALKA
jgi:bifunctional enzyme CysN/CysC